MAIATYIYDRDVRTFVRTQTNLITGIDLANNSEIICQQMDLKYKHTALNIDERLAGRSLVETILAGHGPHDFTIVRSFRPDADAVNYDNDIPLFYNMFDVASGEGSFALTCTSNTAGTIDPVDALSIGDTFVLVDNDAKLKIAICSDNSAGTISFGSSITLGNHLATEQTIATNGIIRYSPLDAINADKYLTLVKYFSQARQVHTGGMCDTFILEVEKGKPIQFTFSGKSKHYAFIGHSTLSSSSLIGDNHIHVTHPQNFVVGDDADAICFATIEADGSNSEETVLVTSVDVDAGTLSITHAQKTTSASAHGSGAVIKPYFATQQLSYIKGTPQAGIHGELAISTVTANGAILPFRVKKAKVEVKENFNYVSEIYGEDELVDVNTPASREVNVEVTLSGKSEDWHEYGLVLQNDSVALFILCGNTVGKLFGCVIPKIYFDVPDLPQAKGKEIEMSLKSRAVMKFETVDLPVYQFVRC